jgi:hypothetical protein
MTNENYDWDGAFNAIETAMGAAAARCSAEFAGAEAERWGLIRHGDVRATYQDKTWEKAAGDVILRLRWHCYDPSSVWSVQRDRNVLSLELRQGEKVLRQAESRYED